MPSKANLTMTFILYGFTNGEHWARVVLRSTKRTLAIARGTQDYTRRAYAESWEAERRRLALRGVRHGE